MNQTNNRFYQFCPGSTITTMQISWIVNTPHHLWYEYIDWPCRVASCNVTNQYVNTNKSEVIKSIGISADLHW